MSEEPRQSVYDKNVSEAAWWISALIHKRIAAKPAGAPIFEQFTREEIGALWILRRDLVDLFL